MFLLALIVCRVAGKAKSLSLVTPYVGHLWTLGLDGGHRVGYTGSPGRTKGKPAQAE